MREDIEEVLFLKNSICSILGHRKQKVSALEKVFKFFDRDKLRSAPGTDSFVNKTIIPF